MNFLYISRDLVSCFAAVILFCIGMSLPKKALVPSSILASASYLIYRFVFLSGHEMLGYLCATLFGAICSELLARSLKMPTTVFVIPSVIPLVPGVGLHRSMLCLINNDINGFVSQGIKTLFISGIIAVTVAVINSAFRGFRAKNIPTDD